MFYYSLLTYKFRIFVLEMKVPSCVLWALTKKSNAFKVQGKGAKVRGESFSHHPLNATGLFNASAESNNINLTLEKGESKTKKSFRSVFVLAKAHKSYH